MSQNKWNNPSFTLTTIDCKAVQSTFFFFCSLNIFWTKHCIVKSMFWHCLEWKLSHESVRNCFVLVWTLCNRMLYSKTHVLASFWMETQQRIQSSFCLNAVSYKSCITGWGFLWACTNDWQVDPYKTNLCLLYFVIHHLFSCVCALLRYDDSWHKVCLYKYCTFSFSLNGPVDKIEVGGY